MIETERLVLRPVVPEDFDESHAMYASPDILQFIGTKPATREEAWTKFLRNAGQWAVFGYGIFTIREKMSGSYLGETGLAKFERGLGDRFDPFPEAAWVLASIGHGRGYATEAVRAAHDWMGAIMRAERTVCIIHPENTASLRIAEKMQYRPFGNAEYRGAPTIMFERLA